MSSRYLLSVMATLVLAVAGLIVPTFATQGSFATASPTVSVSSSAPAYDPAAVTVGTQAQNQPATAPTEHVRIRSHPHNPTIATVLRILTILIVSGGTPVHYAIFKATQRSSTSPTTFNDPNGPQYGVIGDNYGTLGTGYGTAGIGYGTAGIGYGIAADAAQPGSPAYGTGIHGYQQNVQGPYETGF